MKYILMASEILDSYIWDFERGIYNTATEQARTVTGEMRIKIKYMSYKITQDGIRFTDKGIAAVQNFSEPRTVKEVHSF